MPFSLVNGVRVPIRLWAPLAEVDTHALRQLRRVAGLPWVAHHVARRARRAGAPEGGIKSWNGRQRRTW